MNIDQFNEIIDYAIEREKEAVAFYHDLKGKAKFAARVKLLEELENMEKGHINALETIRSKGFTNIKVPEVTNMNISEHLIEEKTEGELTYQEILITAMKREERSNKLYKDLANEFRGTDLENIFKKLAAEEAQHKLTFEEIYDQEILKEN